MPVYYMYCVCAGRSESTHFAHVRRRRFRLARPICKDIKIKGLPLETKNTQNHENRRLGSIESLHMQH